MQLTFLGTGASSPSRSRNVSSMALTHLSNDGAIWLFDCGEGTQHQFLRCPLKISKVRKIFITHLHGDHLFGLPGLLASRALQAHGSEISLYGPKGLAQYLDAIFTICHSRINYPLHIHEIEAGKIIDDEDMIVTAGELDHRITCFGFRIEQKDKCAELDKARLERENIPLIHYHALVEGKEIQLDDGRTVQGRHYWKHVQQGKVVAIFGDTRVTEAALPLAQNADLLVHEATYDSARADKADEYGHSTTLQTAQFAHQANVKKLIVNHISNRYATADHNAHLLNECRQVFSNTELAKDFTDYII